MSETGPQNPGHDPVEWGEADYTDGKKEGQWQSSYPPTAWKWITFEIVFLALVFFGSLAAVLRITYLACGGAQPTVQNATLSGATPSTTVQNATLSGATPSTTVRNATLSGATPSTTVRNATPSADYCAGEYIVFLGSLASGILGGCCFGIKCMYHFVALRRWHGDRRLWRLCSPFLSGAVSLFMVFLVAGGLVQIFDRTFLERPTRVMAFSFLVGYFSDKALAKMAAVADTLFAVHKSKASDSTVTKEK